MFHITIDKIIEHLPDILQYFIPGYIGLCCFRFAAARKYKWETQLIASCVTSFLLVSLCRTVAQSLPDNPLSGSIFLQALVSSALAAVLGIIGALIVQSGWLDRLCTKLFNVSPRASLLSDTLDIGKGVNIRVFFKNDQGFHVYGHYMGRDCEGTEQWLYITEPCICDEGTGGERQLDPDVGYLCRMSDVSHIIVE